MSSPVAITLPDGSVRRFDGPVTGTAIAGSISKSLGKAAIALKHGRPALAIEKGRVVRVDRT